MNSFKGTQEKMTCVSDSIVLDGTKKPEKAESQESTNHVPGEVKDLKGFLGVLSNELKNVKVMKRGSDEKKIQKVPEIMVRNDIFKKYFKPRELSIGPIHAANPKLFKKELKLKLAAHFIEKSKKTEDYLIKELMVKVEEIKKYFDEEVIKSYTNEQLASLVFLDGYAMLGFIKSYVTVELNIFNISNGQAALIQQDLFLLENQMPFTILNMMWSSCTEDKLLDTLATFITKSSIDPRIGHTDEPNHLLDLQRRMLIGTSNHSSKYKRDSVLSLTLYACFIFIGLGSLLHVAVERLRKSRNQSQYRIKPPSLCNVQKLKTAGITFRQADSLRSIFFHVRFFTVVGQLSLPLLVVDSSTMRTLLNLVAYEMCMPEKTIENAWVTSYVMLLGLLIDNEQDVKDLREANIIRNNLSSDIEVAYLIHSIGSNCFPPLHDAYESVKNEIETHNRRKAAIRAARVFHVYFNRPWTVLAFSAIAVAIALAVVQTFFAVKPKN